jgi:hypothetical protein
VKPRIAILGAGTRGMQMAALLVSMISAQAPALATVPRAPSEVRDSPFARPPKEKAQWKRERQGRK